jgi:hypothetical protein
LTLRSITDRLDLGNDDKLVCAWDRAAPPSLGADWPLRVPLPDQRPLLDVLTVSSFYLLPVGLAQNERRIAGKHVQGLVLNRGAEPGEYVRMGVFYYLMPSAREADGVQHRLLLTSGEMREFPAGRGRVLGSCRRGFREYLFGQGGKARDEEVVERHDDGTYTVRIV